MIFFIIKKKIKNKLQLNLENRLDRIIINNLVYFPSTKSLLVSFICVLNPEVRDINLAQYLLNSFNFLINNQIGFNEFKFYNETFSRSSLLANISSFSCK